MARKKEKLLLYHASLGSNKKTFVISLLVIHLFVISVFWLKGSLALFSSPEGALLAIAKLLGLLTASSVLLQLTLIGRGRWLERVFGYDKLTRIHHTNGKYALILIIFHPTLIVTSYAALAKVSILTEISILLKIPVIVLALIAFILFNVIIFSSLAIVRLRLKYETWYFVHLAMYLAIAFAFFHQINLGSDFSNRLFYYYWIGLYTAVIGNFVVFRLFRPFYLFYKYGFYVKRVDRENEEVTSVYISGRNIESLPRQAGQFMIVRFLQKKFWWQAHPFSLSWGPNNTDLRLSIKNDGDYTSLIPSLREGTKVIIDGLYGRFTEVVLVKKKVAFIAGGIGITPVRSLMEEFALKGRDITLLYSNKTSRQIALKSEIDTLSRKYDFPVHYIVTEDPKFSGEKGRIDKEKISRLVPDIDKRDVYVCGPAPFMAAVIGYLEELKVPKNQIHFEKFSLV